MIVQINGKNELAGRVVRYLTRTIQAKAHRLAPTIMPLAAPKLIGLALTAQCNYRCSFCEINGVDESLSIKKLPYQKNPMSLEFIKSLTSMLKNSLTIDFGGLTALGEPLIAPDFLAICKYLRSVNQVTRFHITTNGSLLDKSTADILVSLMPLTVTFSLHAISEQIYKETMHGSFEKTISNIRYFCSQSKGLPLVERHINFGVGKHNCNDGMALVDFAKENDIDFVHCYFYYQSPNDLSEDFSFYSDPAQGNEIISQIYDHAQKQCVKMIPARPPVLNTKPRLQPQKVTCNEGHKQCAAPYDNLIFKSDPFNNGKSGLCVCNRIVPFDVSITSPLTTEDLEWIWKHPLLQMFRYDSSRSQICKFCRCSETPFLRSTDYSAYKEQRDLAVKETLAQFQHERVSPSGAITLHVENVYSI